MAYPIDGYYSKQANDYVVIGFRYSSPDLEAGQTITSANITVPTGLNANGNYSISNNDVSQMIYGGTAGSDYDVSFLITISTGAKYTRYYKVIVY